MHAYNIEGGLVDRATSCHLFELCLLDVGPGHVGLLDVHVDRSVVRLQVLHCLAMLVHAEVWVLTEIVVFG